MGNKKKVIENLSKKKTQIKSKKKSGQLVKQEKISSKKFLRLA